MKSLFSFLKTTVIGGFLIIIPLLVVYFVLAEAVDLLIAVTQPIAERLPGDWIDSERDAKILALLILLGSCFIAGMIIKTRAGVSSGHWLEKHVLQKLPGYRMAKTLTRQFTGSEEASQFAPAVLRFGDEDLVLVYIIEEHDNGHLTVLIPGSPVGTAGGLRYVPGERVKRLNVPLGQAFNCVTHYGIGSGPLFVPHTPGQTAQETDRPPGGENAPGLSP